MRSASKAAFKNAWPYQDDVMNLPVGNVDEAMLFYESVFGFTLKSRNDSPHRSVVLARDGIRIGLVENGGDPTQDGVAFEVDSVEAAFAEFKANGLDAEITSFKTEQQAINPGRSSMSWRPTVFVSGSARELREGRVSRRCRIRPGKAGAWVG